MIKKALKIFSPKIWCMKKPSGYRENTDEFLDFF